MIGAVSGAVLGNSVSYWIGRRYGGGLARLWPFSLEPDLLPNGMRFFERHGGKSVFIGRFFGPIRAVIPLAAGIMRMPRGASGWPTSPRHWSGRRCCCSSATGRPGRRPAVGSGTTAVLVFSGLTLFVIVGMVWAVWRAARRKR